MVVVCGEVEGRRLLVRRQNTGHVIIRLQICDVIITRLTYSRVQKMVGGGNEGRVLLLAVRKVDGGSPRKSRRMVASQGVRTTLSTVAGGRSRDRLVKKSGRGRDQRRTSQDVTKWGMGEWGRVCTQLLLDYVARCSFCWVIVFYKLALVDTLLLQTLLFQFVRSTKLALVLK